MKFRTFAHASTLPALAICVAGCRAEPPAHGPATAPVTTVPETARVAQVEPLGPSFVRRAESAGPRIGVRASALDTELLMTVSSITPTPIPMFHSLKTRIVKLIVRDGALQLLDVSDENESYGDATRFLTTYDIVEESGDDLFFDFASGVDAMFTTGGWLTPEDVLGLAGNEAGASTVERAYVEDASRIDDTMFVRVVARLRSGDDAPTVELRFTFEPYAPDPRFVPQRAPRNDDTEAYFVTPPQRRPDLLRDDVFVAKWARTEPVVFAVSANTPPAFQDAVRDGVLYWNTALGNAFGNDLVDVVMAPAGIEAPDPRYNLIQWVPFDTAQVAYADAQVDPRTGQVLHANVFLPSAAGVNGRGRARSVLALQAAADAALDAAADAPAVEVQQANSAVRCQYDVGSTLRAGLLRALSTDTSDALILRAAQDAVRQVVAHEVGHTLGLLHNFAGSLGARYDIDAQPAQLDAYLAGEELPEHLVSTSSVMDYLTFFDGIVNGARMRRGLRANTYDARAMRILYGDGARDGQPPLFCTGSRPFLDCATMDVGRSPIESAMWFERDTASRFASALAERYAAERALWPGVSVDAVSLSPVAAADAYFQKRVTVMRELDAGARLLRVERSFPVVDDLSASAVRAAVTEEVLADLDAHGGIAEVLGGAPLDVARRLPEAFDAYVHQPGFDMGEDWDGAPYAFSDDDLARMQARVEDYAALLETELLRAEVDVLSTSLLFPNDARSAAVLPVLAARQRALLLATTGADEVDVVLDDGEEVTVRLPRWALSQASRMKAAKLLAPTRSAMPQWGTEARRGARIAYDAACVDEDKDLALLDLNPARQSQRVMEWLLDARAVRAALP